MRCRRSQAAPTIRSRRSFRVSGRPSTRTPSRRLLANENALFEEARVFPLEAGEPAAAIGEMLAAAGPGRMRLRIDVEFERIALGPVGRIGDELGAVGHHHLDAVVIRVDFLLHGSWPSQKSADSVEPIKELAGGRKAAP